MLQLSDPGTISVADGYAQIRKPAQNKPISYRTLLNSQLLSKSALLQPLWRYGDNWIEMPV